MSLKIARHAVYAVSAAMIWTLMLAGPAQAATANAADFTSHWAGFAALAVFFIAYLLVIGEESLHLRKSKPVILAAGIIWALVAIAYAGAGDTKTAEEAVRHNLLEFAELFLFLLAAMTFINTMDERGVFDALRSWLVSRGFSFRAIFWLTGLLSFVISPIADNLTTALLMATVILAVGGTNKNFVVVACINVVVAANAGGAFSPFGDITTLMVWQKGLVGFTEFFALVVPSLPSGKPDAIQSESMLQHGAWVVVGLFIVTVAMAVTAHGILHLPPVMGMMTGLGLLKLYGYYLKRRSNFFPSPSDDDLGEIALELETSSEPEAGQASAIEPFNIFKALERAEWDTLMFFYGVILAIGGLGTFGYLTLGSNFLYGDLGPTTANVLIGFLSAVVDNIPVMFAVLSVMPEMDHGQWLLVTLTAGVGGSMLSIGSAAGVAVMGQARGTYTFLAHLKWSWAIALGYAASIWVHLLINADKFQ
jgi:Na+/H+ antiporter NhaD/arsenite permease-like protein